LKPTGPAIIVVGNSRWNDTQIPTCSLVAEAASDHFDLIDSMWYPLKNRYMSFKRHNKADIDKEFVLVLAQRSAAAIRKARLDARHIWSDSLSEVATETARLTVSLSNELATILSSQLYRSPLKAIEELVVNGYDAGARVPPFRPWSADNDHEFIVVFDNGSGMDEAGLIDLWHIGHSRKREAEIEARLARKQIGKFGIGKLATYTIAHKLTYVSKKTRDILSVSLDFSEFTPNRKDAEANHFANSNGSEFGDDSCKSRLPSDARTARDSRMRILMASPGR